MERARGISRNIRFLAVPVFLGIFLCGLIYRLYELHSGKAEAHNLIRYRREIKALRGMICDCNGAPLAVNETGWKIYLDPLAESRKPRKDEPPPDPVATCRRIASLTGKKFDAVWHDLVTTNMTVKVNEETGLIKTNYQRYVVQGVSWDPTAVDLSTNKILYVGNVGLEPVQRRYYPQGRRLAHILGVATGPTPTGRGGGVEQRYDSRLKGADGFIEGERAGNGREIRERRTSTVAAIDGAAVYLTIDQNIQRIVYEALSAAREEWRADGARAIVQRVDTGEILAMVSLPDFEPEMWHKATDLEKRNRAISDQYDPGSTMKAVTVAAGLNEGIITPDSTYDVGQGLWHYGSGKPLRDHVKGVIDVRTIIAKSSNIGAAMIALDLGNKRFERYLKAFGFGSRTQIDLPGEALGTLMPAEKWEMIRPTRIAIGQGISVTPLQMVNAYSTIANGGRRMRPFVVKKVVSSDGETLLCNMPKVLSTPIKPETAKEMREMLKGVVKPGGTARRARVAGYEVAGKTGTSQIIKPEGGYYEKNHWASFIGFLPADNPIFTVLVLMDNPQGPNHDGGVSAAPVFAEIALATAQYLEIPIEE